MTPDDPRHGTTRGFHAGCRDACCRAAIARYEKQGRLNRHQGKVRAVPAIGAQRRIRALMAIGWTSTDIAEAAGWTHRNRVMQILNGQYGRPCTWITRSTHNRICVVFEDLAMRLPDLAPHRARTRALALRRGYETPLMWDDIDLDVAPVGKRRAGTGYDSADIVDEATVLRILSGEVLPANSAERREVMRRWLAAGKSERSMCDRMGWKDGRYVTREDAA